MMLQKIVDLAEAGYEVTTVTQYRPHARTIHCQIFVEIRGKTVNPDEGFYETAFEVGNRDRHNDPYAVEKKFNEVIDRLYDQLISQPNCPKIKMQMDDALMDSGLVPVPFTFSSFPMSTDSSVKDDHAALFTPGAGLKYTPCMPPLSFQIERIDCPHCFGVGYTPQSCSHDTPDQCSVCKGLGKMNKPVDEIPSPMQPPSQTKPSLGHMKLNIKADTANFRKLVENIKKITLKKGKESHG